MAAKTETLRFKIERPCKYQSIYLRWRNPLGGLDSFLFSGETEEQPEINENTTFQDVTQRHSKVLSKSGSLSLTVRAGLLTTDQYDAIAQIMTSPEVVRAYPVDSGKKSEPVYVVPGSITPKDSQKTLQDVELRIEIRKLNALTN